MPIGSAASHIILLSRPFTLPERRTSTVCGLNRLRATFERELERPRQNHYVAGDLAADIVAQFYGGAMIKVGLRTVSLALVLACPGCESGGALLFAGEDDLLGAFEHDTGFLPAGSPVQVRAVAQGHGAIAVSASGTASSDVLTPVAGSGAMRTSGGLGLEIHAHIDTLGIAYDGLVHTVEYELPDATASFEPFLLDGSDAETSATLPPAELARVPIPSVPGATLVLEITGGEVVTRFAGTCAAARAGRAEYLGALTLTGTIDLAASVEIDAVIGSRTFGPFPITLPIPAIERELDLGTLDVASGARLEDGASPCHDPVGGDASTIADGATNVDAGAESRVDGGGIVDSCASSLDCGSCTARDGCGFCESDARCVTGDGSGPSDGTCTASDWAWVQSDCAGACVPTCAGRVCGDDGCGGSCGACDAGFACSPSGCALDPIGRWEVYVIRAQLPERDGSGSAWDPFGGLPDPQLCLTIAGSESCAPSIADTLDATWSPPHSFGVFTATALQTGMESALLDDDLDGDDRVCGGPIAPNEDAFRSGTFSLVCGGGGGFELTLTRR